jgi:hypothetical protein
MVCYNRVIAPFIISNSSEYKRYIQSKLVNYDPIPLAIKNLITNPNTFRKWPEAIFPFGFRIKSVRKL